GAQRRIVAAREGGHAAVDARADGSRAEGGSRADRHAAEIDGCIRNSLEGLAIGRYVEQRPAALDLEAEFLVLHGLQRRPVGAAVGAVVYVATDVVEVLEQHAVVD